MKFNLVRYFLVTSFITLLVAAVILGEYYRQLATSDLTVWGERQNITMARTFANVIWPLFGQIVQENEADNAGNPPGRNEIELLHEQTLDYLAGTNIAKIKIYNLQGVTIYSSDPRQIGADKSRHEGFIQARNGRPKSYLVYRDQFYAATEQLTERNLLSSYIPIYDQQNRQLLGVFELYSDVTDMVADIGNTRYQVSMGIMLILSLIYSVLYLIIRRAANILNRHDEQHQAHAHNMWHQAYHHALTLLPNRRYFKELLSSALDEAIENETIVALLFLDIDHFKTINDSLGHEAGDSLLRILATRLRHAAKESDVVAHLGGDEFTVILKNLSTADDARIIGERFLANIARPVQLDEHELTVTTSIGITIYPFDDLESEQLIKDADMAMYESKKRGGNCLSFFTRDMRDNMHLQMKMDKRLNQALRENQFVLYYQPQVNMKQGTATGVEALIRWQHPEKGLISPVAFIEHLERNGLIVPIGKWVLDTACRQIAKWHAQGLTHLDMSVNISAREFEHSNILNEVENALARHQLPARSLKLEITESLLMHDVEHGMDLLRELHELGVQIYIDDFGTGYSSFAYLKSMPIDGIKLDRSFVHDMDENPDHATIVAGITRLAHELKLDIVAEGVENAQQLDFLFQQGCAHMQGTYFTHPQPADRLQQWLLEPPLRPYLRSCAAS
ncbi:MAG: EAL domain-containing protein [Granulosicoccaceae bacterium]|jgi:diguanylate cyclase (GGDEF)-like protein